MSLTNTCRLNELFKDFSFKASNASQNEINFYFYINKKKLQALEIIEELCKESFFFVSENCEIHLMLLVA